MSAALRSDRSRLRSFNDLPALPWFIVPFPRSSASGRELLTLSTFQTREAYEVLVRDGVLIGDSTRGWDEFQEAYAYLIRVMKDRGVPGPADGMLWLWPNPTRRRIRSHAKQARGEVLLTVRLSPDQVVISEFADWHFALNRMLHVPQGVGEGDEAWETRWGRVTDDFDSRVGDLKRQPIAEWPPELRDEIENSWEAIFDPTMWHPDSTLQATTHQLRMDDIIGAVRIR